MYAGGVPDSSHLMSTVLALWTKLDSLLQLEKHLAVLALVLIGWHQSISVGAVAIAPHSLHSCLKSYQPTVLVSASHITVMFHIIDPQIQTSIGSPRRSSISNDYILSGNA